MSDITDALRRRTKIEAWLVDWLYRNVARGGQDFDEEYKVEDDDIHHLADAIEREIDEVMK